MSGVYRAYKGSHIGGKEGFDFTFEDSGCLQDHVGFVDRADCLCVFRYMGALAAIEKSGRMQGLRASCSAEPSDVPDLMQGFFEDHVSEIKSKTYAHAPLHASQAPKP